MNLDVYRDKKKRPQYERESHIWTTDKKIRLKEKKNVILEYTKENCSLLLFFMYKIDDSIKSILIKIISGLGTRFVCYRNGWCVWGSGRRNDVVCVTKSFTGSRCKPSDEIFSVLSIIRITIQCIVRFGRCWAKCWKENKRDTSYFSVIIYYLSFLWIQ